MEKIKINEPNFSYNIYIENNILEKISKFISLNQKVFIICDNNIFKIYNSKIAKWFENYDYKLFEITACEDNKSLNYVSNLIEFLVENHCTRNNLLISLGGGVVGDITGFVASIYNRGINYIQIPTTLLAMVDSSVGGKTGINWGLLKNVIGSFYSPKTVLIDPLFLFTLDKKQLSNGLSEVIKYALISNNELILNLKNEKINYLEIIKKCLIIKKDYVEKDYYDLSIRKILNFGHTIGHSIEKNYQLLHGYAVGLGMVYSIKLGIKLGLTKSNVLDELIILLNKFELPSNIENYELEKFIIYDKKRKENTIDFILLEDIGKPVIKPILIKEVHL